MGSIDKIEITARPCSSVHPPASSRRKMIRTVLARALNCSDSAVNQDEEMTAPKKRKEKSMIRFVSLVSFPLAIFVAGCSQHDQRRERTASRAL
jgi:hypothetical protein